MIRPFLRLIPLIAGRLDLRGTGPRGPDAWFWKISIHL